MTTLITREEESSNVCVTLKAEHPDLIDQHFDDIFLPDTMDWMLS